MDIKERLEEFRSIEIARAMTQQELSEMQCQILKMQEFPKLSKVIEKATNLMNEIQCDLIGLETEQDAIFQMIDSVEKPLCKTVLLEKYIKGKTVKEVAIFMQCSESTTMRLLSEALGVLQKISA